MTLIRFTYYWSFVRGIPGSFPGGFPSRWPNDAALGYHAFFAVGVNKLELPIIWNIAEFMSRQCNEWF